MSVPFQVGDRVELTIDRLAYDGGRGVARHEGVVIFVGGTAPQEKVLAEITSIKKNFAEARLEKILTAGPSRRQPPCPVVDRCGGCPLQHISYEEQLRQKRALVEHQLRKFLPTLKDPLKLVPAPQEYRYRNRVQIHARKKDGQLQYGFFAPQTNDLVPISDCLISQEILFQDLKKDLSKLKFDLKPAKIELAIGPDGARRIRDLRAVDSIFAQVNTQVNAFLTDHVVQICTELQHQQNWEELLDLYCGDGNLTFPLREALPQTVLVTGIEFSTAAISRAAHKAESQNIDQCIFSAQDVGKFLKQMRPNPKTAVVVDPPRAGLGAEVTKSLLRLKPKAIIYVSCNLSTLARDLDALATHYEVTNLAAFDMFPQTEHIETVTVLLPRATN